MNSQSGRFTASQTTALSEIQNDGVMLTLDTLTRTLPYLNTVTHLLDSYDEAARTSLQGRHNGKSGRYNTTDLTNSAPEYRWASK